MNINFKNVLPHIVVILLFIIASLGYFSPVLQGKKIFQSDIVQYTGMAKQQNDFRKQTGEEPYWTDSAFGGMPTYQLGAHYPHNYVKKLDGVIRFLPRPADYLFLYFLGAYVLLLVLRVPWKLSLLGALAFGFSTYLIIILGVGHNAKAHAIGYFAFVIAGILLTFRKNYIWGPLLTAVALALEIGANHIQMTYYLMFLVAVIGVVYLIQAIKNKEIAYFFKSVGLSVGALVIAMALNATNLMATKEYADWSTRGKSELTFNADGTPKDHDNGLSKEYITEYSYGISESLNLLSPGLYGGSNGEKLGTDSNTYKFLTNQGVPASQASSFVESLPTYWGEQPIVAAPAYIGAVVIFLFVLGLFLIRGKVKWWLVAGTLISLILSWGKHVGFLTDLMIDFFPLYNKFRAVSSIQVILELCVPVMGVLALKSVFDTNLPKEQKLKALKKALAVVGGLCIILLLGRGFFSFQGYEDDFYRQQFTQMGVPELMDIIILDRKAMFSSDLIRSLLFVVLSGGVLWAGVAGKLKENLVVAGLAILIVIDLTGVDRRYVNQDDFVQARMLDKPFQENAADLEILKDTTHFRVYEPASRLSGARASYFHHAIGGYHAAKPGRFNELFDYQIANNNVGVLNMLNVKYIIQKNQNGVYAARNPFANGNAWFVHTLIPVTNADEEMKRLDSLDVKKEAVVDITKFPQEKLNFVVDSTAGISLKSYAPNHLVYNTSNTNEGMAIFSEMYYPHGWQVTIDGAQTTSFRANYVLRALKIPAGKHTVEFRFEPSVIEKGSQIVLGSTVIFILLVAGGIYAEIKKRNKAGKEAESGDE